MLISVVIPTRNRYHLLQEAVGSLLSQSAKDQIAEIVVVNNGSTDHTGLIAELDKRVRVIDLERNIGIDGAIARGIQSALTKQEVDAILLCDDDSVILEDTVQKLLAAWAEFKGQAVINALPLADSHGLLISPCLVDKKPVQTKDELQAIKGRYLKTNKVHFNGSLIGRSIIAKAGCPQELFFSGEETAWGQAIADAGFDLVINTEANIFHPSISIKYLKLPFIGNFGIWELPDWKTYFYARNAVLRRRIKQQSLRFWLVGCPSVAAVYGLRWLLGSDRRRKLPLYLKGYLAGVRMAFRGDVIE